MALGPGKYNFACTWVREQTEAQAVVVIVTGGKHGSGFSVQATAPLAPLVLAEMLEGVARQMRADVLAAEPNH